MNYTEIEEIKKEFYLLGSLHKTAVLECVIDNIFTYHLYDEDGSFHEISIINEHATFMKEEKIVDLLDMKNTFYLSHRYFVKLDKRSKEPFELMSTKQFRKVDYLDSNE